MSDPLIGTAISGLGLGLEIFDRIRQKLVAQPDPAAERLCAVFDQLRGMYSSLDAELSAFSGMVFWSEMERREYAQRFEQLSRLSPEPLRARFAEAQAHCSTIGNIYDRFLKSWFERLLNKTEQDELAKLFDRLNNADEGFVGAWMRSRIG